MTDHLDRASAAARAFIEREHGLFIDDVFEGPTKAVLETEDPSTGRLLSRVTEADATDVDRAVQAARRAFEDGRYRNLTPAERERLLLRLAELLDRDASVFAELDALEMGKPLAVSLGIVRGAAAFLRYMAGWATKIHGRTVPPSPRDPSQSLFGYTLREPVGVCACIVPWNVAVLMAAWKLGPALATGCSVVLKPAEGTPLTALKLAELVREAGFPAGVVNIVTGRGPVTGQALVEHPDVAKIAFTGSTAVGRAIGAKAGGRLARVTLELGGKSPLLILPDADLETAARTAAHAAFYNTGQICGAGTRLIVPRSMHDELVEAILGSARTRVIGRALDEGTTLGPAASRAQRDKVARLLGIAQSEGGHLLGVGDVPEEGYFVLPTVVTDVTAEHTLFREEVFGPVLTVTPYDTFEEAIGLCNATEYGLAAGIQGRDFTQVQRAVKAIRAGVVWVNTYHVYDASMPFGGVGQSGIGRELGEEVLDNFLETKAVTVAF
jgi:phenylacetaldehyde dehydrogenase